MLVEYIKPIISNDVNIQKTAIVIGRLENKAIGKLINDVGIVDILDKYLSTREINRYYKSKFKLRNLFIEKRDF